LGELLRARRGQSSSAVGVCQARDALTGEKDWLESSPASASPQSTPPVNPRPSATHAAAALRDGAARHHDARTSPGVPAGRLGDAPAAVRVAVGSGSGISRICAYPTMAQYLPSARLPSPLYFLGRVPTLWAARHFLGKASPTALPKYWPVADSAQNLPILHKE
jgi:hypothetical protein